MKVYSLLYIILLYLPYGLLAQEGGNFDVKKVSDEEEYIFFPVLSGSNSYVIDKINTHLRLGELETTRNDSIFDRVTRQQIGLYGRKTDLEYTILSNTGRNFAVCFYETSSGMTMHYWHSYHNFNPQNGDRYVLRDFFTDDNYHRFRLYVAEKRQQYIKEQIIKEHDEITEYGNDLLELIADDELNSFYFTSDSIFFDNYNLLSKNGSYHELSHVSGVSISEIKHLLNDFGMAALVTGDNLAGFRSQSESQLYEGKVGDNTEIYMLFRQDYADEYIGIYANKADGKGRNLRGTLEKDMLKLTEYDDELEKVSQVVFRIKDNALSGIWQSLWTKEEQDFQALRK